MAKGAAQDKRINVKQIRENGDIWVCRNKGTATYASMSRFFSVRNEKGIKPVILRQRTPLNAAGGIFIGIFSHLRF
jgi:hypothetical protein